MLPLPPLPGSCLAYCYWAERPWVRLCCALAEADRYSIKICIAWVRMSQIFSLLRGRGDQQCGGRAFPRLSYPTIDLGRRRGPQVIAVARGSLVWCSESDATLLIRPAIGTRSIPNFSGGHFLLPARPR